MDSIETFFTAPSTTTDKMFHPARKKHIGVSLPANPLHSLAHLLVPPQRLYKLGHHHARKFDKCFCWSSYSWDHLSKLPPPSPRMHFYLVRCALPKNGLSLLAEGAARVPDVPPSAAPPVMFTVNEGSAAPAPPLDGST
mmetsp:Transcript_9618/g.13731  ORF Transcript_9618/g.13731 Transcript_9618/m.13731 type:complete len:139 (-) Transcript_9618:487-903(-)